MSVVVRTAHPQLEMLVQRWHPSATEEISVDEVDTIAQHYANEMLMAPQRPGPSSTVIPTRRSIRRVRLPQSSYPFGAELAPG